MKKLFTLILSVLVTGMSFSQTSLGIVGQFTGWAAGSDVAMTNDGTGLWTATNVAITQAGGVKFRWDNDWAVSYGFVDVLNSWPAGSATSAQGGDIPAQVGFYDVTFDMNALTYEFVAVTPPFDNIGFNGNFNSYGAAVPMFTTDGIQYLKSDFQFTAAGMKFINATASETFGGTMFPMGAAVLNGPEIPVTTGFYNVGFDKSLSGYGFQQVPVGIIGSAIPPYDWTADVPMTSTDGGVTFTLNNFAILDGVCKFRANASWATNWGGTGFPSGTADLNGNMNDLAVVAGTYNISFNRVTGAFSFVTASLTENQLVKVSVSPNPANEVVNFNIDAENFTITLVDMAGKVVATSTSNDMNISSLNNGLYTYLVNTANGVATGKLIKQ